MKKIYLLLLCLISLVTVASAQAFQKGALLISLSEGGTYAHYSISGIANDGHNTTDVHGDRDPLTIEYGLTDKWGIGINIGTDIYNTDARLYGIKTSTGKVQAFMSEFTFDGNYHYFVSHHLDLSVFGSLGHSSLTFSGNNGDASYKYTSAGLITRAGGRAKYYVTKRLGFMAMASTYATATTTKGQKENTLNGTSKTTLCGYAIEFGLCFHLLK